jgi:hypothetical protein
MTEPLLQEIIDRDLARLELAERVDLPAQHFAMYVNMVNDILACCVKQEKFFNEEQQKFEQERRYNLVYCTAAHTSYQEILSLIHQNSDFDIYPYNYQEVE